MNRTLSSDEFAYYKQISAQSIVHNDMRRYTIEDWSDITDVFARRLACLFKYEVIFEYGKYKDTVTPLLIYDHQKELIENKMVFSLCAFSEFLLDYYKSDFWHRMVKHTKNKRGKCKEVN
ncbi:MAG: hypothetical protein J6N21_09625 [Butyrivibrio sp.]|nr:hypothetical protein [Butyrivibrio sp.]